METANEYKNRVLKAFEALYYTIPGRTTVDGYGHDDVVDMIEELYVNGDLTGDIVKDRDMVVVELDDKFDETLDPQ